MENNKQVMTPSRIAGIKRARETRIERRRHYKTVLDSILHSLYLDFKIKPDVILSAVRKREIVMVRSAIYQYLLGAGCEKKIIGELIGGRNHATVINGLFGFEAYGTHEIKIPGTEIKTTAKDLYEFIKESQREEALFI